MRQLVLAVIAVLLFGSSTAWALDGTANEIEVTNGAVGIIDPLIVAKGGTGAASLTDGGVLVGNATAPITALAVGTNGQILVGSTGADPVFATLVADLGLTSTTGAGSLELDVDILDANDGTGAIASDSGMEFQGAGSDELTLLQGCADGEILKWDDVATDWECQPDNTSATNSTVMFSTLGTVTGGNTVFSSGANVSATENNVEVPVQASNFVNMRCASSVAISGANTVTVTGRKGTCGTLANDTDVQCVITGGATECSDLTGTFDTTIGQCISFGMVWSASAETATVNCSIERTT
jgi:hypothetical protein